MTRTLTLLIALAALSSTARAQGAAQAPVPDAKRGAAKVQMCIGCHGIVGYQADFPQVYKVPMIAGQDAKYIASALTQYRAGDRRHPTMRSIAASLTDQDIGDIAAYYSQLGKPPATAEEMKAPHAPAPAVMKSCVDCHGANFSTPNEPTVPRLAGQYPDYIAIALQAYKTDGNPHFGRKNATMSQNAQALGAADIDQIAAYLATLPSELRVVPQPKFK